MELKNLITFIHVAELCSFTKASERLGFSQSTVSFQIRQLEEELNLRLFDRINHTVVLTAKGREVLNYAHQINKLTQALKSNIQDPKNISGHVRLATADSLCTSLLSSNFDGFRKQYPGISLKIETAGTEEIFQLLNQNQVDAVLTLDNHIYNTEYVIVREKKVQTHFVAAATHPLCRKSTISIQELIAQPFILTEKGTSYRRMMEERLAEISLAVQPILEIGSTELICTLVSQGIGISFLPDYVTEKAVSSGILSHLPVEDFEIDVWKQLLYHYDKWVSPQMESVLNYCIKKEF